MIRDDFSCTRISIIANLLICSLVSACGGGGSTTTESTATATSASSVTFGTAAVSSTRMAASPVAIATSRSAYVSPLAVKSASALGRQTSPTTAATTTVAELQASNGAAWPFVQPPLATLRASGKKVFAHYFTPFPVSIDNLAAPADYYGVNYLVAQGEGGKFAGSGGYIKQRPLPRVPQSGAWDQIDALQEVRRAVALGIDGFAVDLLASSGPHWDRARRMLDSANAVDTGFKILLMPDMTAEFQSQPQNVIVAVRALAAHPAAYRLADGRLVLAPYNAQSQSVGWWTALIASLHAEGIQVAFFPIFQGWYKYAATYAPISVGLSDWGTRSPTPNRKDLGTAAQAHGYKTWWMDTVAPQDSRPKDFLYWEARNSENYRVMWENAIAGGSDWVHIVSWNDYSEASEIAPSSGTQWSFYDLTAYYTAWFKTGNKPAITRDVLFYFHRRQATTAAPSTLQTHAYTLATGSDAPANDIELLAFTTAPGTLRATIGGKVFEQAVAAGMATLRVPLAEGTATFTLLRNGITVTSVSSAFNISNSIIFQDMLYRSGSSARGPVAPQ